MTTKNLKAAIRGYTLADYLTMEAAQAEETLADYLNGRDIATHATHYAAAHGWAYTPEIHAHTVQAIHEAITGDDTQITITLDQGIDVTIADTGLFTITHHGALTAVCVDLTSACHTLETMGAPHETIMQLVYAYDAFTN